MILKMSIVRLLIRLGFDVIWKTRSLDFTLRCISYLTVDLDFEFSMFVLRCLDVCVRISAFQFLPRSLVNDGEPRGVQA
jgi:hypothetical protein